VTWLSILQLARVCNFDCRSLNKTSITYFPDFIACYPRVYFVFPLLMQEGYPPALLLNDWRVRYIHGLNAAHSGQYAQILNLIGQSAESGLDLYLEACETTGISAYQLLSQLEGIGCYTLKYLSWLARQGRIDAVKRNGRWHSIQAAIEQYKAEAEAGKLKRGRPPLL
jgi:hypothetical protein